MIFSTSFSKIRLVLIILALASLTTACSDSDDSSSPPPGSSSSSSSSSSSGGAADFEDDFAAGANYDAEEDATLSIDNNTLAVTATYTETDYSAELAAAGLDDTDYVGAVDPAVAAGSTWWEGWALRQDGIEGDLPGADFHPLEAEIGTTINGAGANGCVAINADFTAGANVTIFGESFPVCVISENIDANTTLTNDHVYLLDGSINVGDGDVETADDDTTVMNITLTVNPGTQIFGITGTSPALVITRGSQIQAVGTEAMPIIFGAVEATNTPPWTITDDPAVLNDRTQWGSLVLSGYGMVNNGDANNQTTSEATPDGVTRWFGGTDNTDSSGNIEYVIIAESGEAFRPDEEIQGLTIEAAGSGTSISFVQITNSDDDGIEWFGGAAGADHLIIQGVTDDSLDMDLGYQGAIQYALIIQGHMHGDHGIESDNNGSNFGATPKTSPVMANLTILGNDGNEGAVDLNTNGALHREGFGGQVYRSVYTDNLVAADGSGEFGTSCLDLDDEVDEDLFYGDVVFNCVAGTFEEDD